MDILERLRIILSAQLGANAYPPDYFRPGTPLLGTVPELDSMAVVGILAAVEDEFDVQIADDEVSADAFMTVSSLLDFVQRQVTDNA